VTCYAATTHKHEDSHGCATPSAQMVRVQDPFKKLLARPFTKSQVVDSPAAPLRSAACLPPRGGRQAQEGTVREVGGVRIAHSQVVEVGEV
jgi:hypothetical protein